jgi:RNA 2',3'-cyclic 3'-phosphodiesterase
MIRSVMNQGAINGGRLFFAVVPDADASARIFQLAGALKRAHKFPGKLIAPERLHVSLFFLGEIDEQLVRIASDAAAEVRALPFDIWLDRSASFRGRPGNRAFVLIGEDGVQELRSFRRTLGAALAKRGLKRLAKRDFTPHVTLLYAERRVEEYPIEPIRWTVNEFVLVHSIGGHRHIARWPLGSCRNEGNSVYDYSSHTIGGRHARDSTA